MSRARVRGGWGLVAGLVSTLGCAGETRPREFDAESSGDRANCPTFPIAAALPPGTHPEHERAEWWIARVPEATTRLIDPVEIEGLNTLARRLEGGPRDLLQHDWVAHESAVSTVQSRQMHMAEEVTAGRWVEADAGALVKAGAIATRSVEVDHIRLVLNETPLRCVPMHEGIYRVPVDDAFDRNACSSLHPGEALRVLRRTVDGRWLYVRSPYATGWVDPAALGPPLGPEAWRTWTGRQTLFALDDTLSTEDGFPLRMGVAFPVLGTSDAGVDIGVPDRVSGIRTTRVLTSGQYTLGPLPLTRAGLLELAFSLVGHPYGWGGRAGHRDCSRFLRDVFAVFGIALARHSGVQALQGDVSLDVTDWPEEAKNSLLDAAARVGVVLVYMPGHIMLYLGRDGGDHYAISALSEWLEPCPGGTDTVYRIDRVAVSTLELGRATERRAFIERITRIVIFGRASENRDPMDRPPDAE